MIEYKELDRRSTWQIWVTDKGNLGKFWEKRPPETSRRKWEDNIKKDLKIV